MYIMVRALQLKTQPDRNQKKKKRREEKLHYLSIWGDLWVVIKGDLIWHLGTLVLEQISKGVELHLQVQVLHPEASKGDSIPELVHHLSRPLQIELESMRLLLFSNHLLYSFWCPLVVLVQSLLHSSGGRSCSFDVPRKSQ